MTVLIAPTPDDLGPLAADALLDSLGTRRVLGLATGSSPQPLYRELIRRHDEGLLLDVRGMFALDEYVGLTAGHPQSYRSVLLREFVTPLGLDPDDLHLPPAVGSHDEIAERAGEYDLAIAAAGGIDVQVLGIGSNGHIGFNEPFSPRTSTTRLARLTEQTRRDNTRFFGSFEDVPAYCVTQGIATIMRSRHALVIATGESKADAVRRALEEPVDEACPASLLREHPRVTWVLDEAAASLLAGAQAAVHTRNIRIDTGTTIDTEEHSR